MTASQLFVLTDLTAWEWAAICAGSALTVLTLSRARRDRRKHNTWKDTHR